MEEECALSIGEGYTESIEYAPVAELL
jgi:hypothetical protein